MGSALATSNLFVEDALGMHSLLAFEGSSFVKKALSGTNSLLVGGLLAFMGGTLVKKVLAGCCLEAVALVLPQFVDRPLPILVGAFLRGREPQEEWAPQAMLEAAGQQPVSLCAGRDQSNRLGRCRPSREHAEEAVTIYIAATQKDRRGRTRTNEPAVIHRSSFGEGKGGGLDSFVLVPT